VPIFGGHSSSYAQLKFINFIQQSPQSERKSTSGQSVFGYACETWAIKVEVVARFEMTERMVVRLMCAVHLKRIKASAELNRRLGIECTRDVVRRSRL